MKKLMVLLLALLILCTATLSVSAAGTDDGTLTVAEKNGAKYFGTEIASGFTKYLAANGDGSYFYDLTGDKDMNICDLVALYVGQVDLDQNDTYNADDCATLRLMLLGGAQ